MSQPPRSFLGVTVRVGELDRPVTKIEIDDAVSAGIRWRSLGVGLVPVNEEHSARESRGIHSLKVWYEMEPMERALVVAKYRIDNASANLQAMAEAKAAKQRARKANKGKS